MGSTPVQLELLFAAGNMQIETPEMQL